MTQRVCYRVENGIACIDLDDGKVNVVQDLHRTIAGVKVLNAQQGSAPLRDRP